MSRTKIRRVIVTLIASVVAIAGLVMAPSLAFAGSNGQQVEVCNHTSEPEIIIDNLSGINQNGTPVNTSDSLSSFPVGHADCYGYRNWWFVGEVTISGHGIGTQYTLTCDIPVSQGANWSECDMVDQDNGGAGFAQQGVPR